MDIRNEGWLSEMTNNPLLLPSYVGAVSMRLDDCEEHGMGVSINKPLASNTSRQYGSVFRAILYYEARVKITSTARA
jgi:hypothetical protein